MTIEKKISANGRKSWYLNGAHTSKKAIEDAIVNCYQTRNYCEVIEISRQDATCDFAKIFIRAPYIIRDLNIIFTEDRDQIETAEETAPAVDNNTEQPQADITDGSEEDGDANEVSNLNRENVQPERITASGNYSTTINGELVTFRNHSIVGINAKEKGMSYINNAPRLEKKKKSGILIAEVIIVAYQFDDALYGVVIGLTNTSQDSTTKTISSINSTNGADRNLSAALIDRFARLLINCTTDRITSVARNSRESISEV